MVTDLANKSEMRNHYNKLLPQFFKTHRSTVTEEQLLKGVKNGALFGFLLVDIHTPDNLKGKFEKFPPIFANHTLRVEDVGE